MRFCTPRIVVALSLSLLVLSGCATARTNARPAEPASSEWAPSLEGLYARMAAAMSQPGRIYHPTISTVELSGARTFTTRSSVWIDVAGSRARGDVEATFGDVRKQSSWIIEHNQYIQTLEYDPPFMRAATTCRDSDDPLLALLLACRTPDERGITVTLESADYHGATALAVLTQGVTDDPGGRSYFTETLFVDPLTFLPIAIEGSGRVDRFAEGGAAVDSIPIGRMVFFQNTFVPSSDIDVSQFDPAAFGYNRHDPVHTLTRSDPDFTPYWLSVTPELEGLPELTLAAAYDAAGANRPALRYRLLVTYRPASDEFGPTLLRLEQWRRDEWEQIAATAWHAWRDAPCVQRWGIDADNGTTTTIYAGYGSGAQDENCPSSAPTEHSAVAVAGETVIRVSAPADSPYNSKYGIEAAVEALMPAN